MNVFLLNLAVGVSSTVVVTALGASAIWVGRNFELDIRRTHRWFRVRIRRLDLIRASVLTARIWPRGGAERLLLPNSIDPKSTSTDWEARNSVFPLEEEIGTAVGCQTVNISFSTRSRSPITIHRLDVRVLERMDALEGWFRVPLGLGGGSSFIEGVVDLDGNPPVFAQLISWNGKGKPPSLEVPKPFTVSRDERLELALTVFTSSGAVRWGFDLVGSDGQNEMTIPFRDDRFMVTAADETRQAGWIPEKGISGILSRKSANGVLSIAQDIDQLRTALGRTRY
jgi:hypothetical protein